MRGFPRVFGYMNEKKEMTPSFSINAFCKGNHTESKGSHYSGSEESLLALVRAGWEGKKAGFTDGVWEVTVPAEGFFSGVVDLKANPKAVLLPSFAPRRDGEDPVLSVRGEAALKAPAGQVRIIVYSHDVLAADGDNSTEADFEVITILAEPAGEPAPMPPITMARNLLGLSGGTKGEFSPEDFAKSIMYWAQNVVAGE
jgi:hypothetical protein